MKFFLPVGKKIAPFIFASTFLSTIIIMKEARAGQLNNFTEIIPIAERIINEDTSYISRLMKEVAGLQTFFASGIMQLSRDLKPEPSEDIISLYLVVWGLFRQYPACLKTAVTRQQFERIQQRNISMFRYLDNEDDTGLFDETVNDDYEKLSHGALMQYISHCFQTWPSITEMDMNDYCIQLIGIKSFIECFEEIVGKKQ